MSAIEIKTNRKEIEIIRDGQNVGVIYFSPSDTSIIARLYEAQKRLENISFDAKESDDMDSIIAEMHRCDGEVREALDYVFGYPVSDIVFGGGFTFTTENGVSSVEQFLDGALKIIEKEVGAEAKKAQARQNKYLAKYKKK